MKSNCSKCLGIYSFFGFRLPLIKKLEMIKKSGFDSTTLWWGDEIAFAEASKDDLPAIVRDKGLYLENIHVPYNDINKLFSPVVTERNNILNKYLGWIEDCALYNIPIMVMHVTDGSSLPEPGKYLHESFKKIVQTAEQFEINVAIENTERNDYINFLLNEFDSDYLVFCYDSSHAQLHCCETDILIKWNHRLATVHLSDNDGKKDRHWLPGKGIINWDKVCNNLTNYHGCLTLETFARVNTTAEKFLQQAYIQAEWIKNKIYN